MLEPLLEIMANPTNIMVDKEQESRTAKTLVTTKTTRATIKTIRVEPTNLATITKTTAMEHTEVDSKEEEGPLRAAEEAVAEAAVAAARRAKRASVGPTSHRCRCAVVHHGKPSGNSAERTGSGPRKLANVARLKVLQGGRGDDAWGGIEAKTV